MADLFLVLQTLAWVSTGIAIILFIYEVRRGILSWAQIGLGLLFLLNLFLFLTERLLVKTITPELIGFFPPGFINAWANIIQLHAGITAAVAAFIVWLNRRVNGHGANV